MLRNNPENKQVAATNIQRVVRGFFSRKRMNIYGQSAGKEIEIYLPWGIKKIDSEVCSYDMIGYHGDIICESDLFSVQIEDMNFKGSNHYKIIEIVTAPFHQPNETRTNLFTEQEIDEAVSYFIALLEDFTQQSPSQPKAYLRLDDLMRSYNKKQVKHPLRMEESLKHYLKNPVTKHIFSTKFTPVKKHRNIEICFIYEPDCQPIFDSSTTPRTPAAADLVARNAYKEGKLLVHIQKTFSLPIEKYKPGMCNEQFHITEQQLEYLREARQRSKEFILKNPLPANANQEKVLGLLTVCVEHVITVTNANNYKGLHEKADRPVLSIRHILHYVKKNICNEAECGWFAEMFKNEREDIQWILCKNNYEPDYKGNHGEYGNYNGSGQYYRYDAIFDLFGDFKNGYSLPEPDEDNRLTDEEFQMGSYGITSWKALLSNHISISGRNHFRLQKVITTDGNTEYHPLFEARRIGLMTPEEFKKGESRVSLDEPEVVPMSVGLANS